MVGQPGLFDVEERLRELSAKGDDLERIAVLVDFVMFRAELERAVPRANGAKGGRPAFDEVHDPAAAGHARPVGRALQIAYQGPAFIHALPRPWPGRPGA